MAKSGKLRNAYLLRKPGRSIGQGRTISFFFFKWRNSPVVRNIYSARHELSLISVSGIVFCLSVGQVNNFSCIRRSYLANVMWR